jgi:hypothetical protein
LSCIALFTLISMVIRKREANRKVVEMVLRPQEVSA